MSVHYFNSIGDFRAALPGTFPTTYKGEHVADSWTNYQTYAQAQVNLLKGRLDVVPEAEKLLEKFSAEAIETHRQVWRHSVAGYFPCVPSFLSDSPESMRIREETQDNASPVRVFASVCVSGGIDSHDLRKRGIAILALCQKLQEIRPVELWVYADLQGRNTRDGTGNCCIPCVKVETAPLDLSTATYALTDAGFLRQLCFAFGEDGRGFSGRWAWTLDPRSQEAAEKRKRAFQATDDDLIIPGGFNSDPLVRNPVAWVNEQLKRFAPRAE